MNKKVKCITCSLLIFTTLLTTSNHQLSEQITTSKDTVVSHEVLEASRSINEELINLNVIQRLGLFLTQDDILITAKEDTIKEVEKECSELYTLNKELEQQNENKKQNIKRNYHSLGEFIQSNQELCVYYGIKNEDDLRSIIATCYGEDTLYPEEVMCTIINRVETINFQNYGTTLIEQVTTPCQFVAYKGNTPFYNLYNNPNDYLEVLNKCLNTIIDKYYFNIKRHDYCSFRAGYDTNRVKLGSNYFFATTSECGGETKKVQEHNASLDSLFEYKPISTRLYEEKDIVIELIKNAKDISSLQKIITLYKINIDLTPNLKLN